MTPRERGEQVANGNHRQIGTDKEMMNDGQRQHAVGRDAFQEGGPFSIHIADTRGRVGDVHDHRRDGGGLLSEPLVHLLHCANVKIGGEDGGTSGSGDARVVAGVTANVEHVGGLSFFKKFCDKGLLRGLGLIVVGANLGIVAPDGCGRDGLGQAGNLLSEPPQGHALHDGIANGQVTGGYGGGLGGGCLAGLDSPFQRERQTNIEHQPRAPTLMERKRLADLQGGTTVKVGGKV